MVVRKGDRLREVTGTEGQCPGAGVPGAGSRVWAVGHRGVVGESAERAGCALWCAGAFGVTGVFEVTWEAFRALRQVGAVGAESFGKERGCWGCTACVWAGRAAWAESAGL